MALPVILVLFIVVPIAELAVIISVGREIGVGPTVLILLADSVLGSLLLRSQGRAAWRRFSEALQAGRPPAREVVDGVLIVAGGALLLTPGFLSDIVGILLLAPPTRALFRGLLLRRIGPRIAASMVRRATAPRARPATGARPASDIEGRVVDVDRDGKRPRP